MAYKKERFTALPEDERKRILEALQKRRERRWLEERQLYEQALEIQSQAITGEGKRYLRKKIHGDVKRLQKVRDEMCAEEDEWDAVEWERGHDMTTEDKIYYGSDSTSFVDDCSGTDSDSEEDGNWEYGEYGEEGESVYEYYDEDEGGESEISEMEVGDDQSVNESGTDSQLAFDDNSPLEEQKVPAEESKGRARKYSGDALNESQESATSQSSSATSKGSTRIIQFDEDDNIIEKRSKRSKLEIPVEQMKPRKHGAGGTTIEMTDLRPSREMREFQPSGKVNQTQKKREKRKAKKAKELELKAQEEAAQRQKALDEARKKKQQQKKGPERPEPITNPATGKVMKRKVVPKRKVLDEQGVEWEVVDQRKTIIVDESDDSEDSGSGDSEMAFADDN